MDNKKTFRQITVSEMAPHVHTFYTGENRVDKIAQWLANWIKSSLEKGKIKPFDFLPLKGDLAFHTGVSKGTIQNAYRIVEDMGLIESKQRIGTYIAEKSGYFKIEKLTSKREFACSQLKKYIKNNKIPVGSTLESIDTLSEKLKISKSTIRNAINSLIEEGIIEKSGKKFILKSFNFAQVDIEKKTLTIKISEYIKHYISENLSIGDKLPSNIDLSKKYNVSVKTIHDALKFLQNEGIVYTRRGKYGTIVVNSDSKAELYIYEKIKIKIREYIIKNCDIGAKLPAIAAFAKLLNTSSKTVKNALDELADEGYVAFSRGRYGGTFVTDIPQAGNDVYTWLAINPSYMHDEKN